MVYKGSLMALRKEKSEAIRMRKEGASYSQIKEKLKVSKSSLSLWLHEMPLPEKRLRELRDWNVVRIERFRNTMRRKREGRWAEVRKRAAKDIRTLSKRELLIAGLFLYWGEGTKTSVASTSISNTDPAMIFVLRKLVNGTRCSEESPTSPYAFLCRYGHKERITLLVQNS